MAYPIVRALPVAFVPVFGLLLSTISQYATHLSIHDWLAYTGIILGTLLLLPKHMAFSIHHVGYLVLAALGTTGYSITDHFIQRQWGQVRPDNPFTLGYLYILLQGWATVLVGFIYLIYQGKMSWRFAEYQWKNWAQTGLVISGSYFLILVAMVFVPNASDIVAFRQISIPIGFLLGVFIMKEKASLQKVLSVLIIFLGLVLISLS